LVWINPMYLELLNHYALYPLNLQLIITFALVVRFGLVTHCLEYFEVEICLISSIRQSNGQNCLREVVCLVLWVYFGKDPNLYC
jgi:hypothetical protein